MIKNNLETVCLSISLFLFLFFCSCNVTLLRDRIDRLKVHSAVATEGYIDFQTATDFNMRSVTQLALEGEWLFYPSLLVTPTKLKDPSVKNRAQKILVTQSWNEFFPPPSEKSRPTGEGVGSYLLTFKADEKMLSRQWSLKLNQINLPFTVFFNGEAIFSQGKMDLHKKNEKFLLKSRIVPLGKFQQENQLLIQLSNSGYWHDGGFPSTPYLIDSEYASQFKEIEDMIIVSFISFFFFIGIFWMVLFCLRVKSPHLAFFSLGFIFYAFYLIFNDSFLFLGNWFFFDFYFQFRLMILFLLLAGSFIFIALHSLFQKMLPPYLFYPIWAIYLVLAVISLVLPLTSFYLIQQLIFYHFLISYSAILIGYIPFLKKRRIGAKASFFATFILFAATLFFMFASVLSYLPFSMPSYWLVFFYFFFAWVHVPIVFVKFNHHYRGAELLFNAKHRFESKMNRNPISGIAKGGLFASIFPLYQNYALEETIPLTCGKINIDFFKDYALHHGMDASENLLKQVAHLIKRSLRNESDFLCHKNETDFFFVLLGCSQKEAEKIFDRLLKAVESKSIAHKGVEEATTVSISIGAVVLEQKEEISFSSLVKKIDLAFEKAKEQNCYAFFHSLETENKRSSCTETKKVKI